MIARFEKLLEELRLGYPECKPELSELPDGGFMLDFNRGNEEFVLRYIPALKRKFGINNLKNATFGWEGFEHAFDDFDPARESVLRLLRHEE